MMNFLNPKRSHYIQLSKNLHSGRFSLLSPLKTPPEPSDLQSNGPQSVSSTLAACIGFLHGKSGEPGPSDWRSNGSHFVFSTWASLEASNTTNPVNLGPPVRSHIQRPAFSSPVDLNRPISYRTAQIPSPASRSSPTRQAAMAAWVMAMVRLLLPAALDTVDKCVRKAQLRKQ